MSLQNGDSLNLIITGVGGQGNLFISRLIAEALLADGYWVTVGESYGASQRGGSVVSHVRIAKETQYGALTPEGRADIILGLEPMEALRILALYGSPNTFVITNTRPLYPMAVATGEAEYPRLESIRQAINELSRSALYIDASQIAINLAAPLLTNMVMVGALVGTRLLPLARDSIEQRLEADLDKDRLPLNLKAFAMGFAEIGNE